jgi:hypothetical protein
MRRPALGGEHHDAHDALPVHLDVVARDRDVALEPGGGLDDLRRRARVQPVLVEDLDRAFDHHRSSE